jgi:hypothetical protein
MSEFKKSEEKVYFTDDQIQQYINLINNEYESIEKLKLELNIKTKNIRYYEELLLSNCKHNKKTDSSSPHERTTYCTNCGLNL